MKTIKLAVLISLTNLFLVGVSAEVVISDIMLRQRSPWSGIVDISYVITNNDKPVDIEVRLFNGEQELEIAPWSLGGALYSVSRQGGHQITWDPSTCTGVTDQTIPAFRVELSAKPVPLYMIIDLTKTPGDDQQIEYVYEEALLNGDWGSFVVDPITNLGTAISSVIWTGVTTNDIYKTDKLVLRRIPAGTFMMNSPGVETTLTHDFYIGVFALTQRQWELVTGKNPSRYNTSECYATRTVDRVSYNSGRGLPDSDPLIDWPNTGHKVAPDSFIDKLRNQTGIPDFDLPTEAQWEYAYRAGTTTFYYDGLGTPAYGTSNAQADVLGRYLYNGGKLYLADGTWENPTADSTTNKATMTVGMYKPNAWGLYDMAGNIQEWCLDWGGTPEFGGVDPVGPLTGTGNVRVQRGGSWWQGGNTLSSTHRLFYDSKFAGDDVAFRVVRHLKPSN